MYFALYLCPARTLELRVCEIQSKVEITSHNTLVSVESSANNSKRNAETINRTNLLRLLACQVILNSHDDQLFPW